MSGDTADKDNVTSLIKKGDILGAQLQIEEVAIQLPSGKEGTLHIKELTTKQRENHELDCQRRRDRPGGFHHQGLRGSLILLCVVNPDGSPMFTKEEVVQLQESSGKMVDTIWTEIQRVCGLDVSEAVEEEVKNS